MTLVKHSFLKRKFSFLSSKYILQATLSSFEDLEPIKQVVCISVEYQTAELQDHCFEAITLAKRLIFLKLFFIATFQIYFQIFFKLFYWF